MSSSDGKIPWNQEWAGLPLRFVDTTDSGADLASPAGQHVIGYHDTGVEIVFIA